MKILRYLIRYNKEHAAHSCDILDKSCSLNLVMRIPNKFIFRDILQSNQTAIFKDIKLLKVKEKIRNCFSMKEVKEIEHLNAICKYEVDTFFIKNISEVTGEREWAVKIR